MVPSTEDDDPGTALLEVWDAFVQVASDLSSSDLKRPTRLGNWTVHELVAHLAPRGYTRVLESAEPGVPAVERAADVLRIWHAPAGAAQTLAPDIADAARVEALRTPLPELIGRFESARASVEAASARGDEVVDYFGAGLLRVREVLRLGVLESTVHLIDLIDALDLTIAVPTPGARITKRLLAEVAPDKAFIDAATGRSPDAPFPVMR